MDHAGLPQFLSAAADTLAKGPVALIFAEDLVEVDSTLRHHRAAGFRTILLFAPPELRLPPDLSETVHRILYDCRAPLAVPNAVNALMQAAPEAVWFYYCYNAEYLFHPFCETRNVRELLAFHAEERRDAMLTYVIDLYSSDLSRHPDAVSLESAHLDRSGYYALARPDPATGHPRERQLDFFGGLRWRYEEHVPKARRKIDRIALFRSRKDLRLRDDHTFEDQEYNTYACPWHNNLTAAVCSFRTAKALRSNAGSRFDIETFTWHNSVRFDWTSRQLLDLGLMEPGQWF